MAKIYKVGGVFSFKFNSPNYLVFFFNNTFEENQGDFGGVYSFDFMKGQFIGESNIYLKNFAVAFSGNKVGSGSIYSMGGTIDSIVTVKYDKYVGNYAETKGNGD